MKQQCDGAGETSITTNYELHGTSRATCAPVAQTLQSVRQTCSCIMTMCPYTFARFPSCGIFIPTRTSSSKNYDLKQQGDGAGETSIATNYELQGTGRATRATVAQTLQTVRQTCLCTMTTCQYRFARFPSCGILTPTRAIPVKITSCNQRVTVTEQQQEHKLRRAGQHARSSHKHCKAYAKHAYAP